MNNIHNAFRMLQYEYPKDLTSSYDLSIHCKSEMEYVVVPPNDWVDFLSDNRWQDGNVHATDGFVVLTRTGKPVGRHIYGMKHYANICPNRDKSDTSGNK